MAKGQVTIDGVNHYFSSQGKPILLVNLQNAVPDDYELDLVEYGNFKVARVCYDALTQMVKDCRNSGHPCNVGSIYRSKKEQDYLWWRDYNQQKAKGYSDSEATERTSRSLMRPGYSEHHTGLAVDFLSSQDLSWLNEHCWDYGFIVRYPEGKTDVTGIIYEPWHFRYVGTELALELKNLGLCMEEYIQMLTEENNS